MVMNVTGVFYDLRLNIIGNRICTVSSALYIDIRIACLR